MKAKPTKANHVAAKRAAASGDCEKSREDTPDEPARSSALADLARVRAPYWLLVRGDARHGARHRARDGLRLELFTADSVAGKALLVFGSEREAELFLGVREPDGYRARETWATELLSALAGSSSGVGPCAGVERIAFNPPPESVDAERAAGELDCVGRRSFLEHLMGRRPSR